MTTAAWCIIVALAVIGCIVIGFVMGTTPIKPIDPDRPGLVDVAPTYVPDVEAEPHYEVVRITPFVPPLPAAAAALRRPRDYSGMRGPAPAPGKPKHRARARARASQPTRRQR